MLLYTICTSVKRENLKVKSFFSVAAVIKFFITTVKKEENLNLKAKRTIMREGQSYLLTFRIL